MTQQSTTAQTPKESSVETSSIEATEDVMAAVKVPLTRVRKAVAKARGSYAIGVIHADEPGRITATRVDSPLVLGVGKKENFISSDVSALLDHTREAVAIENGEIAVLDEHSFLLTDAKGKKIKRAPKRN